MSQRVRPDEPKLWILIAAGRTACGEAASRPDEMGGAAMWPDLFGPGWQLQILMAFGLTAVLVGAIGLLWFAAGHTSPAMPNEMLTTWRRYEVGDLTRQEFERIRGAVAARADRREGRERVKPRVAGQ